MSRRRLGPLADAGAPPPARVLHRNGLPDRELLTHETPTSRFTERNKMKFRYALLALTVTPLILLASCGESATPAAQTVSATVTTTALTTTTKLSTVVLTPERVGTAVVTTTATVTEPPVTVTETTTLPPAAPAGPAAAFSDGTYLVGTEVAPGKYKGTQIDKCYWKRMDAAGETIDNDYGGSTLIVVQDGDYAIQVQNCGSFTKVG